MANFYGKNRDTDFAASKLMSFGKSFSRMNGQPLDESEVWYNLDALKAYAKGNSAYVGMKLVYVDETNQKVYQYSVQCDGSVKEIGTVPVGDGKSIAIDAEGKVSLKGIDTLEFERDILNEEGQPTGEKENVRYQPLMTKDGVIWVEPSKTTVEGLATLIDGLTKEVDSAKDDIDALETDVAEIKKFFEVAEGETLSDALDTLKEIQEFLDNEGEDGIALINSNIKANADAIELLNGDSTKSGSVAKTVADAVSAYSSTADDKFATQTAVNTINEKLKDIEANADVNIIEVVKVNGSALTPDENKAVDITVPTKFSDLNDDSGFAGLIQTAQNTANQGVSDASAAAGKAQEALNATSTNAGNIDALTGIVNGHTTTIGEHTTAIAGLVQADKDHKAEYEALNGLVSGNSTEIATIKTTYATLAAHNELAGKVSGNETAIKTLNETTIPAINVEIGKKANSADVYTKTQIGTIAEDTTLVAYIDGKASANKSLIDANTSAIAALIGEDKDLTVRAIAKQEVASIVGSAPEAFDTLEEIATWIGNDKTGAAAMSSAIAANTAAISAINNETTGILAVAKKYTDDAVAGVPVADESTITISEGKLSVKKITTDMIEQGDEELILYGGNSKK